MKQSNIEFLKNLTEDYLWQCSEQDIINLTLALRDILMDLLDTE